MVDEADAHSYDVVAYHLTDALKLKVSPAMARNAYESATRAKNQGSSPSTLLIEALTDLAANGVVWLKVPQLTHF